MGTHLKAGDPAPDFAAPATDGSILRLKDFRGRKLVMYFYPMDDTPGCTKQACSLRDTSAIIAARGAAIVGVSAQGSEALSYQVQEDLAEGRLLPVLEAYEPPPLPVRLVYPAPRRPSARLMAFVELASERIAAALRGL